MSDIDEKIKEWQRMAEILTGKFVRWLGEEALKGAIYATVAGFMHNKLPSMLRSGRSEQEIIQELVREVNQSIGHQPSPTQEENIRRIIQEELSRMRAPQAVPPPPPYPQPAVLPTTYPPQVHVTQPYEEQLRSLEEEISHYEKLRRMLEERWVKGEVQEEEYRSKLKEINSKLEDLRLRRERLLQVFTR